MIKKFLLVLIIVLTLFLRFYKNTVVPPGLYQDEASIGYNAYTILKTGRDEYGTRYPFSFKSFGDYKLPLYIYATSVSIAAFGRNEFAVRFTSALSGSLTVLVFYFFLRELIALEKKKIREDFWETLPLLGAFLLAISPWHIQFSRAGFEATLALFLYMLASLLFLYFYRLKKYNLLFLLISFFLYGASVYTYQSYKFISPLTVFLLSSFVFLKNPKQRTKILITGLFFFVLILPIALFSLTPQGSARLLSTSAFAGLGNQSLSQKLLTYPFIFIKNYISYFSSYFLFDVGDGIGRHQIPNFGPVFKWQFPFMLIGIYALIKEKINIRNVVLALFFIAPIPAAVAVPSPHTLRSFLMVIPITIFVSVGILFFIEKLSKYRKVFMLLLILVAAYEFFFYTHYYYTHYPQVNLLDWGAEYKQTVEKAQQLSSQYDVIIVDKNLGFIPVYFHFYAPDLKFQVVDVSWKKPESWRGKKVLYIRPFYGQSKANGLIYNATLPNKVHDIYSQFWSI